MTSSLLPNLLHFSRLLGSLGLDIQAVRTLDVVQALEHVDIGQRADFYHTLRCLLVHRPQDLRPFDEAFRVFWRPPPEDWTTQDLRAMGEERRSGPPQYEAPASADSQGDEVTTPPVQIQRVAALTSSDREVLRTKDFGQLTDEEVADAQRMMAEFRWDLGTRLTRRWRSGRGVAPDLRHLIRANASHGYEPVRVPTRQRKPRQRPLVLLCDVSGSMERYSRMLLHFLYCMKGRLDRVEVFVFATRLTRVTRYLDRGLDLGRGAVVPRLPTRVPDFAGGTRIGEALRTFNLRWARRVLGHGAVVLVISDGWDRGDPEDLGHEMARLQRTAHRLIWLNPLLGSTDYAPLTRGLQAALPHIDDFLPVHNLESLVQLGQHLRELGQRAGVRKEF